MNGKSNWAHKGALHLALAIAASALILGGCVAETGDEDEGTVTQTGSADAFVPRLPKDPGGIPNGGSGSNGGVPSGSTATSATPSSDPGAPREDPDPNPWKPGSGPGTR